jgi:hypothetical protein
LRIKHRTLARNATAIGAMGDRSGLHASFIKLNAERIALRYNTDVDDSPGGIAYDAKSRCTGPSTPTEAKALAGTKDEVERLGRSMVQAMSAAAKHLAAAEKLMAMAESAAARLLPISDKAAQALLADEVQHEEGDTTKGSVCANLACRALVARTPNDRLREGRCRACYVYRKRTGHERPRFLCVMELDESRVVEWAQSGHKETPGQTA